MLLSVIIPAYNAERYIERCVQSVVDSYYDEDIEVIVIDDGSTDRTGELCDKLREKDKRIQYYLKANGGVSSARNFGLSKARGEYIAFLDSDDFFFPEAIIQLINELKSCLCDILCFGFVMKDNQDNILKTKIPFAEVYKCENGLMYFEHMLENNMFPIRNVWACIYKKVLLDDNCIMFDETYTWSEDFDFCLNSFEKAKEIYSVDKVLYCYMDVPGSAMKTIKAQNLLSDMKVAVKWLKYLEDNSEFVRLSEFMSVVFCNALSQVDYVQEQSEEVMKFAEENIKATQYAKGKKYRIACLVWRIFGVKFGGKILRVVRELGKRN